MPSNQKNFGQSRRTVLLLLTGLLALALWAYFTELPPNEVTATASAGKAVGGDGGGSGDNGNGSGTGSGNDSGSGSGTGENDTVSDGKNTEKANVETTESVAEASTSPDGSTSGEPPSAPEASPPPEEELPPASAQIMKASPPPPPPPPSGSGTSGKRGTPKEGFYSLEVKRKERVMFLVDVSGSMAMRSGENRSLSRIDILKRELIQSISGEVNRHSSRLPTRKSGFLIASFEVTTHIYPEKGLCSFHKEKEVAQAIEHINGLKAGGDNDMMICWRQALDRAAEERIETIYFLADGEFACPIPELEKMIIERKLANKLAIHCIAIGGERPLLKEIAKKFRGNYVEFR